MYNWSAFDNFSTTHTLTLQNGSAPSSPPFVNGRIKDLVHSRKDKEIKNLQFSVIGQAFPSKTIKRNSNKRIIFLYFIISLLQVRRKNHTKLQCESFNLHTRSTYVQTHWQDYGVGTGAHYKVFSNILPGPCANFQIHN